MSTWRRQALENLPEFRTIIDAAESPMALWIELQGRFDRAMESKDSALVHRILMYASWCASDKSGRLPTDASTAVICGFYEHLPTKRDYWPHFREWFFPTEFAALLPSFSYFLSEDAVAELKQSYGAR